MIKQGEDSAVEFDKLNQKEAAEKERAEAGILKQYLPPQLSEEEILKEAEQASYSLCYNAYCLSLSLFLVSCFF